MISVFPAPITQSEVIHIYPEIKPRSGDLESNDAIATRTPLKK